MPSRGGPPLPYKVVGAVTPCPGGWLVASAKLHGVTFSPEDARVLTKFAEVFEERPQFEVTVVNAPIGYPDENEGLRSCDRMARALLRRRGMTVRNIPMRSTVESGIAREDERLDAVTLTLLPRYAEVAAEMLPYRQRSVYEAHPELSFYVLNGDKPLTRAKHSPSGEIERRVLLERRVPGIKRVLATEIPGVSNAHLYDVAAMLWTARRAFAKAAVRLPQDPEWDSEGLRKEIVR